MRSWFDKLTMSEFDAVKKLVAISLVVQNSPLRKGARLHHGTSDSQGETIPDSRNPIPVLQTGGAPLAFPCLCPLKRKVIIVMSSDCSAPPA